MCIRDRPWGAYSVSRRSQTHRLEKLLQANGILVDGHIVAATRGVSHKDQGEISAITRYLVEHHDAKPFRRWLDPATFAVNDSTPRYSRESAKVEKIVKQMGLEYELSLIHISEPTRLLSISYAVFCLK